ncbi:MAG TPA: alpha-hydroxy-acid oxidizing protein [Baekduia sp.]|uniref:alpha-hydroxy-acid oxidizing protein n=1 Tax=Baekduia sp. TaxID=2600305 RepID=UPI002CFB4AF4|nr:alpha-hydroxy-acid oxidizing protein [Baekduia sp.]HMJ34524.1 alpha-hydroxy-acid oxidizing protein [Baekduia sp.]
MSLTEPPFPPHVPARQFGDFQLDIYFDGLEGRFPKYPVDFASLERKAEEVLPWWVHSYVAGGCGDEHTQRLNVSAFHHWGIVPRMLNGANERDLSISLLGMDLPTPLLMSPIGVIGICAQDFHGDLRVAEAAAQTGVPMIASTLTMDPMEDVAARFGATPGLFQLYTPSDRDLAASFVQRAERAGFKAIVVTLDTWTTGWRPRDLNGASFPQLRGYCLENYFSDETFLRRLSASPQEDLKAATREWIEVWGNSLQWDDLSWLRSLTDLPIALKGICHPDDARRARDHGIDAIYCSNHGGRQANGGLAAIDLLPDVVKAAGDMPVIFDSGVRSGSDVAKALAMGATAVGVGRPYAYALAVGGTDGVVQQLKAILAELDLLMAIDGYPTIADLRKAGVRRT